jgi:RNA polymerase sigma-54 factor
MELVDMVRDEMLENPILEDSVESGAEQAKAPDAKLEAEPPGGDVERVGETEMPMTRCRRSASRRRGEGGRSARRGRQRLRLGGLPRQPGAAAPMPSYKSNNEDLPSLESTLTRGTSLFDHLEWQLKLSHFSREEDGIAMLIIGNLTPMVTSRSRSRSLAEEAGVTLELAEAVLRASRSSTPWAWRRGRSRSASSSRRATSGADDEVVVGIIQRHLPTSRRRTTRRSRAT